MKYMGQPYNAALKPLLILTPKEKILVDTGMGELPEKYQKLFNVKRKSQENLRAQLAQHGLRPEDIDIVVNTHLHFDHCGNNELFKNAKVIVQADEYRYAFEPDRFQQVAYMRELFDIKIDYEHVHGERQIDDDVFVVPTSGHSIGHQSVIVKADGKNYVYCGDAAPTRENLERRNIPGVLYCAHKALKSIDHLRAIENAVYIYSHDNEQLTL
jgi:glyoxylase-like metal-dependent hydrolase (beta-lactamase superfamily II)